MSTEDVEDGPSTSTYVSKSNNAELSPVLESFGYSLGKTIGSGSFAIVKVASSREHNCDVAIKIVNKEKASKEYLEKFLPREIDVIKRLTHENLIQFYQAMETNWRVYIIMELAEKGTILDIIRKEKYIDEDRAKEWFSQLVSAIDYCHQKGVVHRDIKCDNLLMTAINNIKLTDFGFARGNMKPVDGMYTLSSTYCGSYAYASPEILKGIPYRPQASDIWSMGVVLYAIVVGRLPFDDSNYSRLVKQVTNKVEFPLKPKLTSDCKKIICNMIAPLHSRIKIPQVFECAWFASDIDSNDEIISIQSKMELFSKRHEAKDTKSKPIKKRAVKKIVAKKTLGYWFEYDRRCMFCLLLHISIVLINITDLQPLETVKLSDQTGHIL